MALGSSTGAGRVHEWLPFQVDCWELADQQGGQSKPGFLTHAHTDHTHGIEAWARQQGGASFFCSEDTWRLMLLRNPSLGEASRRRGGLEVQHVEPLEPCSVSWGGQSFEVVALDANHCQGGRLALTCRMSAAFLAASGQDFSLQRP